MHAPTFATPRLTIGREREDTARLAAELRHALRRIRENPQSGSPYELGTRRFILGRFPYAVVYYLTIEGIYVVAVQHHSRDADYWHKSVSGLY